MMTLNVLSHALLVILISIASNPAVRAGDPDIVSDFVFPPNTTVVDSTYFTFTNFRSLGNGNDTKNFTVLKANMGNFPSLNGQSVSSAVLLFPPGSVNPPHTHPRSAELLFLIEGYLQVGFVDTTNKLYNQTLQPGDMFLFPKGLVHFQSAIGPGFAFAYSSFGSADAGTVSVPKTVFATGIDDSVLAKSFNTDVFTIQKIKNGLATPA